MRPRERADASPLVLASRSPQRREILERLGIAFEVRPADVAERTDSDGEPHELARHNALLKARAVTGDAVLGVDTVVALDGVIYGKPPDREAARATLRALSGRTHTVVSGIAIVQAARALPLVGSAATQVRFRQLDEVTLDWYLECGEWRERAGGYAIQGRGMALVASIDGDYSNVVGLPVATMLALAPGLLDR